MSPAVAVVGVVLVAVGMVLLPAQRPPEPGGTPGLPHRFAGYAYLTGQVSASPPGQAIALYQQGLGVEMLDFPQALVLGAGGDVYRRVDLAEARAGSETQGDPAPMLLSPDGSSVAVGVYAAGPADVALLDLATGRHTSHPVQAASAIPLAWSPDGRHLALITTSSPVNPHSGMAIRGDLALLDVASGKVRALPARGVSAAAFAPSGEEIAVQDEGPGGRLRIIGVDGVAHRDLALPVDNRLAGPAAWSPDGRLIATVRAPGACVEHVPRGNGSIDVVECGGDRIVLLDAAAGGHAVPDPLPAGPLGLEQVLGWTGPARVVLAARGVDPLQTGDVRLVEVHLGDGAARELSTIPTSSGNYQVVNLQLATASLPALEVRPAGAPDRGRWPTWALVGATLAAGFAAASVVALLARASGFGHRSSREAGSPPRDASTGARPGRRPGGRRRGRP